MHFYELTAQGSLILTGANPAAETILGVPVRERIEAWLYRIAHNLVANWHRDRSRRRDIRLDDLVGLAERGDGPEHLAERSEEARVLLAAIAALPAERQQVLILKFAEGMSNVEIARVMGRTEGAVKSLYHRTLIALRDELSRRGVA